MTGSPNPRDFCWHCGKKLEFQRGKLIFCTVLDLDNNSLRVHRVCESEANQFFHPSRTVQVTQHAPSPAD